MECPLLTSSTTSGENKDVTEQKECDEVTNNANSNFSFLSDYLATLNQSNSSSYSRLRNRFVDETGSLDVNLSDNNSCHLSDISSVSNNFHMFDDNESLDNEINSSQDNAIDSASSYKSEDEMDNNDDYLDNNMDDNDDDIDDDYEDIDDIIKSVAQKNSNSKNRMLKSDDQVGSASEDDIKRFMNPYENKLSDAIQSNNHRGNINLKLENNLFNKKQEISIKTETNEATNLDLCLLSPNYISLPEDDRSIELSEVFIEKDVTKENKIFNMDNESKMNLLINGYVSNKPIATQLKGPKVTLEFYCNRVGGVDDDGNPIKIKDTFKLHKIETTSNELNNNDSTFHNINSNNNNNPNDKCINIENNKNNDAKCTDNNININNSNTNEGDKTNNEQNHFNKSANSNNVSINNDSSDKKAASCNPNNKLEKTSQTIINIKSNNMNNVKHRIKNNKLKPSPGLAKRIDDDDVVDNDDNYGKIRVKKDFVNCTGDDVVDYKCTSFVNTKTNESKKCIVNTIDAGGNITNNPVIQAIKSNDDHKDDSVCSIDTKEDDRDVNKSNGNENSDLTTKIIATNDEADLKDKNTFIPDDKNTNGDNINKSNNNTLDNNRDNSSARDGNDEDNHSKNKKSKKPLSCKTIDFRNEDIESSLNEIRSILYGSNVGLANGSNSKDKFSNEIETNKFVKSKSFNTNPFLNYFNDETDIDNIDDTKYAPKVSSSSSSSIKCSTSFTMIKCENDLKANNNNNECSLLVKDISSYSKNSVNVDNNNNNKNDSNKSNSKIVSASVITIMENNNNNNSNNNYENEFDKGDVANDDVPHIGKLSPKVELSVIDELLAELRMADNIIDDDDDDDSNHMMLIKSNNDINNNDCDNEENSCVPTSSSSLFESKLKNCCESKNDIFFNYQKAKNTASNNNVKLSKNPFLNSDNEYLSDQDNHYFHQHAKSSPSSSAMMMMMMRDTDKKTFSLSPEITDCDSVEACSIISDDHIGDNGGDDDGVGDKTSPTSMPAVEDGLSSDDDYVSNNNTTTNNDDDDDEEIDGDDENDVDDFIGKDIKKKVKLNKSNGFKDQFGGINGKMKKSISLTSSLVNEVKQSMSKTNKHDDKLLPLPTFNSNNNITDSNNFITNSKRPVKHDKLNNANKNNKIINDKNNNNNTKNGSAAGPRYKNQIKFASNNIKNTSNNATNNVTNNSNNNHNFNKNKEIINKSLSEKLNEKGTPEEINKKVSSDKFESNSKVRTDSKQLDQDLIERKRLLEIAKFQSSTKNTASINKASPELKSNKTATATAKHSESNNAANNNSQGTNTNNHPNTNISNNASDGNIQENINGYNGVNHRKLKDRPTTSNNSNNKQNINKDNKIESTKKITPEEASTKTLDKNVTIKKTDNIQTMKTQEKSDPTSSVASSSVASTTSTTTTTSTTSTSTSAPTPAPTSTAVVSTATTTTTSTAVAAAVTAPSKVDEKQKAKGSNNEGERESFLIEGVLFRAQYLGSTQLISEGQPSKATRLMQAQEAINRIKDPTLKGNPRPSTLVDLFVSVEKIMVLNTDLQEIMMDHALRTISYIADIGDVLVVMARRGPMNNTNASPSNEIAAPKSITNNNEVGQQLPSSLANHNQAKICCHVFESDEAQLIAQSISQAFQVAYIEFLKANGINDPDIIKEMDYQDVLSQQEIFGEELFLFSNRDMQKEVLVPKGKGEPLGMVIVESGWGSMVPTVVLANMAPGGAAARCGQLNIGDQIISVNGISLVGLPLSTCQAHLKALRNDILGRFMVVSCTPVVEVLVKRPDIKYQLGFSVQNGVICSLLRGGIAERGGVRVGHRIIEINGQSVVAVPHDKIVSMLASSVGEIHMKTMQTSIYRLLTGQDTPHYI